MTGTDTAVRALNWLNRRRFDLAVIAAYLCVATVLTQQLWRHPRGTTVAVNRQDQVFFEFALARAARAVTHLENPLFTSAMNTPRGVNMMANTSILGLAVPLSPVTLALGPSVAFVLLTVIALAGTAIAWYYVLSRQVVESRVAAVVGAAFAAFAPGIVSQANAHPNIVAQFLVPLMVWRIVALGVSTRPVRDGVLLGLLVGYQMFINEEILFLLAQAMLVCTVVYVATRPREAVSRWRPYLIGLGVAAGVAGVLLAYPLWYQFSGPQSYHGIPPEVAERFGMDAASYVAFPPQSLFAGSARAAELAVNSTERNSFFGWPLAILLVAFLVWLWRWLAARLAGAVLLYFVAVSLGVEVMLNKHATGISGPWRLLVGLPLFNSVVPARFALGATVAAGVLLALGVDRIARLPSIPLRTVGALVVAVALVPLTPHWIDTRPERGTPAFFADGTWRDYLPPGTSVLMGNTNRFGEIDGMRWSAAAGLEFPVTRGYFLAPDPASPGKGAMFGSPHSFTTRLLAEVARTGKIPTITPAQRNQARLDLASTRTGLVAVPVGSPSEPALHTALDDLLAQPGVLVKGVWVWPLPPGR